MARLVSSEDILRMDLSALRLLDARNLRTQLSSEAFDHVLKQCDALWLHSSNPKDPHAEMDYGYCSNGFLDLSRMLRYTNLCEIMANQIAEQIQAFFLGIDWVIGSSFANSGLSFDVARQIGAQYGATTKGDGKSQKWNGLQIKPDEVVLQVEDCLSDVSVFEHVRRGIQLGNAIPVKFAPFVFTLVNKSKWNELNEKPIHAIRQYEIKSWTQRDCPLCAAGSKRVRLKHQWALLTGKTK